MRKKEKKNLLAEYKHLLIFTNDLKDCTPEDKEFYKGKLREIENVLILLNIEHKELKERIDREYGNIAEETEKFIKKYTA